MQRSWIVLLMCSVVLLPMYLFPTPFFEAIRTTRGHSRAFGIGLESDDSNALRLCISISITKILVESIEELSDNMHIGYSIIGAFDSKLGFCV